jgi:hypothetical protein
LERDWTEEFGIIFAHAEDKPLGPNNGMCRYNNAVLCEEGNCTKCGWNPRVDRYRKHQTRERLAGNKNVEV